MGKEFLKIVDVVEAKEIIKNLFDECYSCECEVVSVSDCVGRVLFDDFVSLVDFPPFDRALKDGYCVKVEDTFGASEESPRRVRIIDTVEAGDFTNKSIGLGECVRISTGACIPEGGEAVLMVEFSGEDDEGFVYLYSSLSPGGDIGFKGSDISKGEIILKKGDVLTPSKIGVVASQGVESVNVYKNLNVGVISTGNELTELGDDLSVGGIYDINSVMIGSVLKSFGCDYGNLGIVVDDYESIKSKILEGLSVYDLVVVSGGTSAGVGDNLRKILDELGVVFIHGISVQPGKPTLVGIVDGKIVVGLPGNPVSALIVFNVFILPVIKGLIGLNTQESDDYFEGVLNKRVHSPVGREQYQLVKLLSDGGVEPIFKDSGAIFSLVSADGYMKVDKNTEMVLEGETVKVKLF